MRLIVALSLPAGARAGYQFQTVDDPLAAGSGEVTGITGSGKIVGYYFGADNANHGFVATPSGRAYAPEFSGIWANTLNK